MESIEKRFCGFEIGGREPFREPVVDWLQERRRLGGAAQIVQQPGKRLAAARSSQESAP
jgi:hypothetical protein